MRILAKMMFFPVVMALTILVAVCRFLCSFSGMMLVLAGFLFLVGLGTLTLLHNPRGNGVIFVRRVCRDACSGIAQRRPRGDRAGIRLPVRHY